MASIPTIPADTSVEKLFAEIMPSVSKDMLASSNAATDLAGTEITMVVDVSGEQYSYTLKNGANVEFKKGDIANPKLRLKVSKDDIEKMIKTQNLDMILGIQNDLNKAKYNALNSLKGSFVAEITNDDGSIVKLQAILNGANDPSSVFKMSAKDTSALMRKETNPVNLFMSGAMKIEGDMAFAMGTQPLFS
ncbi:MAG: SCP2 sterol-binding domain-containing protein [Spirochaetes bacterium]|nr:SCP2 sterol-binding domain-containing protein [Spirochaetota bacterium]